MGLQARYARPSVRMHHVYGSYGLGGPIWIMYRDMQHIGSQVRYARPPGCMHHVYGSYGLAGPIWIMFHDMHHIGCCLVGCSVVSGRPLRSRAVAGLSQHVCVCLGPVLASHDPSLLAAAAAAWRGRGRVPIAGWSYGGVGPERGLRGSTKGARRG